MARAGRDPSPGLGDAGAGVRAGAAHLAGAKEGRRVSPPGLGLCLEVRRRATAAAPAPEADRVAAGGLAGLPRTLAVTGLVGHRAPSGGRVRDGAGQRTAAGGLDHLELCWGPLRLDSLPLGRLAGVPVFRGGAAKRAA